MKDKVTAVLHHGVTRQLLHCPGTVGLSGMFPQGRASLVAFSQPSLVSPCVALLQHRLKGATITVNLYHKLSLALVKATGPHHSPALSPFTNGAQFQLTLTAAMTFDFK